MNRKIILSVICLLYSFCAFSFTEKPVREVGVGIYVDNVDNINSHESTVEVDMTLHFRWNTTEISDKTRYYKGSAVNDMLQKTDFPYYKILNSRSKQEPSLESLTITPNGRADYILDMAITLEVPMDMRLFPFDTHTVDIMITPYGDSAYQEQYYSLPQTADYSSSIALDEWQITDMNCAMIKNNKSTFDCMMKFDRKHGYYFQKILLPLLIILAMSYGLLWLPEQAAIDKITLLSSLLLMVIAFQWVIAQDLPTVTYVTIFQATLLLVYFTIGSEAIFITVNSLFKEPRQRKMIYFARWFYPIFLSLGIIAINYFLRKNS